MALLAVAGNAGGVLVVGVVGSTQCLRPRVLDLPRAFRSDDAVVAEAYFASAEVAVSRGPVVDGVEVVSHDPAIIPQIGNAARSFHSESLATRALPIRIVLLAPAEKKKATPRELYGWGERG